MGLALRLGEEGGSTTWESWQLHNPLRLKGHHRTPDMAETIQVPVLGLPLSDCDSEWHPIALWVTDNRE